MDAREYMTRKGVGVERDPDRPNTLEEKAWARARGAGGDRPKSGTPHDWEDWERYHGELADAADTLEQKIDKQAHRKARERGERAAPAAPATSKQGAVGHFTPPARSAAPQVETPAASPVGQDSAGLKAAYAALAVLLPPLGVGLAGAGSRRIAIALVLTLLGWLPGALYALVWIMRR
ncbi:YqaE/Pmp3 family membrane protein [Vreelandella malpeensis]|uniref:YqaE/Pmp3 family membrane protein n=1 Tax=Vreelandella malpeensis TaxID=1172368 RepID=A0ABS8DV65_9GAMM|nr:YqaE/Pmp3 family membrane protein [Halomonas malpeensis]MCB8890161.1 YqaE/Pmp3 family membrane protein [Halomonas malpeensis]